jgi:ubiquitin-protein ligase E3 B
MTPTIASLGVSITTKFVLGSGGFAKAGATEWLELARSVLAVPGLFAYVCSACSDVAAFYQSSNVGSQCIAALASSRQTIKIVFNSLEGNGALCLLGNLLELVSDQLTTTYTKPMLDEFSMVVMALLEHCGSYVSARGGASVVSHPVFGWFSGNVDRAFLDAAPKVMCQVQKLWSPKVIARLFSTVLVMGDPAGDAHGGSGGGGGGGSGSRATKSSRKKQRGRGFRLFRRPDSTPVTDGVTAIRLHAVCRLYTTLMNTCPHYETDILSGLAFHPHLVAGLWKLLPTLGPNGNMEIFLHAATDPGSEPLIEVLALACDTTARLLLVLDDDEVFEQEHPISLEMLRDMSTFLNEFVFKALWHRQKPSDPFLRPSRAASAAERAEQGLYKTAAKLLRIVLDRDNRRRFTDERHWLTKEISQRDFEAQLELERSSHFGLAVGGSGSGSGSSGSGGGSGSRISSFRRAHCILQRLPHVLPYKLRVRLLREKSLREKAAIAASAGPHYHAPLLTIRRTHLMADGFRELSRLDPNALKDTVKIRFVNEQGLDEAGIDENGVFKEFLEEMIKEAFNPDFGLFMPTVDNQLFPNPNAFAVQPQWEKLFEFVGRLLAKSVYEGHLVEVNFAHFFLNSLLGRMNTLDELPSLDPELSTNLNFVKRYDGNVQDLSLCFAVDEDVLGVITSTPLRPGGVAIDVTNENKILYCHLMADYRLNLQLKKQTAAFVRGFRSLIDGNWIQCFAAPELRRLISGDDAKLDMEDLKRHVAYIGGYASSHRVIKWLWQVVAEFSTTEQGLFLKFVTSCSKPPVLGFSALRPQFQIRAVTDSSADDRYTVGSAIVNFFRPGTNTSRLPTSSTCFHLLKLPIYRNKRALKEKLLTAITAGAGFELS